MSKDKMVSQRKYERDRRRIRRKERQTGNISHYHGECGSKKAYTRKGAEYAQIGAKEKRGHSVRIYKCPYGNHYHLTSSVD